MRETELERAKKRIYVMDVRGNISGEGIEKYSEIYNNISSNKALKGNKGGSVLTDQPSHFERNLTDDYLVENPGNKSSRNQNLESYEVDRNITIHNNPVFEEKESPIKNGNEKDENEISGVVTKKGDKH